MKSWGMFAGLVAGVALGGSAQAACQLQKMAELPITMIGLKPTFPATINGAQVRFIADSGAFFSVISPASAATLNLHPGPAPVGMFMTGIGGDASIEVARARTFGIAKATLDDVDLIVGGSDMGDGETVGVVGENILGIADAEYDLSGGVIRLMRPRGCGNVNFAYWAGDRQPVSVLPIEARDARQQPFIIGTVIVNGARIRATFDTGAGTSVLSIAAARRAGITTDGPSVRFAGYSRGFGRRLMKTWITPVESFQIGDETIKHTELRIGDAGGDNPMLIGADFFLSHHVYVANSQRRMYFTYNGGPVFNLAIQPVAAGEGPVGSEGPSPEAAEPKDADGFSRRGAAFEARRDFDHAAADFSKAVELAPGEPRYLLQRAVVRLQQKQLFLAMADLDAAIKLKPDDVDTRLLRAHLRLVGHDRDGALADVDAASAAAPKPSDLRLQMAMLYDQLGKYEAAIAQYDLWTHDHGDDSRLATALNGRCWARAQAGLQLDQALSDCNTAVRLTRSAPMVLDSRGLVHLRRGEFDRAIADYDAALKLNPKIAWSLYGRGYAEEKTGQTAQGQQDIAAALALQPKLAESAAKVGLTPPAAPAAPVASR